MNTETLRDRVINEVRHIPETHLEEVFDLLHFFRIGLETKQPDSPNDIMGFAGAWQDMDDGIYADFQQEIHDEQ